MFGIGQLSSLDVSFCPSSYLCVSTRHGTDTETTRSDGVLELRWIHNVLISVLGRESSCMIEVTTKVLSCLVEVFHLYSNCGRIPFEIVSRKE